MQGVQAAKRLATEIDAISPMKTPRIPPPSTNANPNTMARSKTEAIDSVVEANDQLYNPSPDKRQFSTLAIMFVSFLSFGVRQPQNADPSRSHSGLAYAILNSWTAMSASLSV